MELTTRTFVRYGGPRVAVVRWLCHAAAFAVLAVALPIAAHAQFVMATVGVGTEPVSVAVNPVTNKIYVAN